ncbi:MAG: AAA family ATPase [Candidatus Paceibacteria bacterium]
MVMMQMLESIRIENYKSINDSKWVSVKNSTTCIVGANEAGKTSFLEAVSRIDRESETKKEK